MAGASELVSVLILDSDPAQRRLLSAHLGAGAAGWRVVPCQSAEEAAALPAAGHAQVVIADLESIGGLGKLGALARAGRPLIATSARGSVTTAVEAMRAGAVDYLPKPIGAKMLVERLEAAMAAWKDSAAGQRPAASPGSRPPAQPKANDDGFEGFIGSAPAMRKVFEQVEKVAPSKAPVFLTGESGTGKEVCAEAIHNRGGAERPFVAINCSAIPKDLIESEVFGHVRGAFTGATENRTGAAELAHGGTLFLDEICEMALGLQAKLLRFIQTGVVQRVGDTEPRRVDVRFICATNRDPLVEAREGRFREDLFYRLNVLPIRLPPLRDRGSDVLALARAFLTRFAGEERRGFRGFAPAAEQRLAAYDWPGNVRQLQNVVRRIVVLHDGGEVTEAMVAEALAEFLADAATAPSVPDVTTIEPFRDQERRIVEAAVAAFGGNVGRAAAALQINPSTIYRKLQAWQAGRG